MDNMKLVFDEEKAFPLAEQRFITTCGFDMTTAKHKKMMNMGLKVREDGVEGIKIQALVEHYNGDVFKDHKIVVNGAEIFCNFFEQIPDEAVDGIYFYIITAGECNFSSEENIMDFLYADIWGTSYVDAGVELLEKKLKEDLDKDKYLSVCFGPGYFGMPVIETKNFFEILDGNEIGVQVKDSGLMIPQKTCSGLYLVLNNNDIVFEKDCMKCHGNKSGCQFCRTKQSKQ
ncbi:MAG: vitamin B12 dependent-methionine synthase activation domain-containing protein [Anaerovoracaceae bacterium]